MLSPLSLFSNFLQILDPFFKFLEIYVVVEVKFGFI